jgi:SAM-dependent methyltransferase
MWTPASSRTTAPSSTRAIASSGRSEQGALEFERTQQIVGEHVPAGSRIIDIGGASGLHAAALAERGDTVVLIDPVPRHVEAACRYGTFTAMLGDARSLPVDDDSFDAAMLLGPLYHLFDRRDRLRAWAEAIRVVRPGGWVFAAGISRLSAMARVTVIGPSIELATSERATPRSPYPEKWRRLIEEGAGRSKAASANTRSGRSRCRYRRR